MCFTNCQTHLLRDIFGHVFLPAFFFLKKVRQWFCNITFHYQQQEENVVFPPPSNHKFLFWEVLRKFLVASEVMTEEDTAIFRTVQFGKTLIQFFPSWKHFRALQIFLLITYSLCQWHRYPDKSEEMSAFYRCVWLSLLR